MLPEPKNRASKCGIWYEMFVADRTVIYTRANGVPSLWSFWIPQISPVIHDQIALLLTFVRFQKGRLLTSG